MKPATTKGRISSAEISRPVWKIKLECGCIRSTFDATKSEFYCMQHDDWYTAEIIPSTSRYKY